MILMTGKAWAEEIRRRYADDPYGLVVARRMVTAVWLSSFLGVLGLVIKDGGAASILLGLSLILVGLVAFATGTFLALPDHGIHWKARNFDQPAE